jgi:phenylalanyl-tRNA synthetase beta chain
MPVVSFHMSRLNKFLSGVEFNKILEILPYIGLDIEGVDSDVIRIEYNPNRPDFASDYGIVRALRGLLEIETGIPKFRLSAKKEYAININESVQQVRPFIVAIVAKKGKLDEETIKQLIGMQEDLHNGIGRLRRKASIGIHNLDPIKFPVTYKTVNKDFSFVPLDQISSQQIKSILKSSGPGKEYGYILEKKDQYPIIIDSENKVLSLPPIINSNVTKVNVDTNNLFVEVTGINQKSAEDILAILAITLYDAGFQIQNVSINNFDGSIYAPKMEPYHIQVDPIFINRLLGLDFSINQIVKYLRKSRLNANEIAKKRVDCIVPRYRTDIIHAIDVVEEVAIGYGIYNLKPTISPSTASGQKNSLSIYINIIRQTLIGLQMLEVVNHSIVGRKIQYELPGVSKPNKILAVDGPKSVQYEILRDTLIPSLLASLSRNVHEEYPQRLFEIGKIFQWTDIVKEYWSLGVVVAHNKADYTEVKSLMQSLLKTSFGKAAFTQVITHPIFITGRCAGIVVDEKYVGIIGEITPLAIDNFKVRVPVAAFELNLSELLPINR